jgi:hypothetical protein
VTLRDADFTKSPMIYGKLPKRPSLPVTAAGFPDPRLGAYSEVESSANFSTGEGLVCRLRDEKDPRQVVAGEIAIPSYSYVLRRYWLLL